MLKLFTTTKTFLIASVIIFGAGESSSQTAINLTPGLPYSQNFDALPSTLPGTTSMNNWGMDEATLDDLIGTNDGSSASAGIYSFGSGTDRALGSIAQSLVEPMLYGLVFVNPNAYAVTSLTIQYTGEQWRFGGSTTDELVLEYKLGASGVSDAGTWTTVNALKFTSPVTTGTVGNLDGNTTSNRTTLTSTITVNIPQNQTIWIRWRDQYSGATDNGLAIDDLTITPNAEISGSISALDVNGKITLSGNTTLTGTTTFIDANSKIDIGSNTLTISGTFSGVTPVFRGSHTSNLTFDGSGLLGTINFDQTTPGTTNVLNNFTINRTGVTVTLGNALNISDNNGSVNLTAGNLVTGGNLTLLSTNTGTARIGALTEFSDITGDVTSQRYMQGGDTAYRGWRTMGAITSNFNVNQLTDDIFVTGPGGAANGFDANGTNSSVMYYEEDFNAGRGWKSIPNTSTSFSAGQGILVFYRGDRTQTSTLTTTTIAPNATTIDVVGPINKDTIVVNLKYNDDSNPATDDGWNFISNPYPSQIHWGNVDKDGNVDDNIAILNPLTNNYVPLGLGNGKIQSHQGFFVKVNATGQKVRFVETNKTDSGTTPYFKTQINPFIIKMYEDNVRYDIALLKFDASSNKNYVFKEDALKMTNSRINLGYITPNGKTVQINSIPSLPINSTDTFIIKTTSIKNGTHWLTFEDKAILPANKNVFLVDGFNNNIIDVKTTNSYTFTINNANSATYGNRFKLIITDQFNPLPVKLATFTGEKLGTSNLLKWISASEKNLINYEVEKSVDGKNFESVGLIKATNSSANTNYSFIDENLGTNSINYYRLKINENKGVNSYSNIISISNNAAQNILVEVYPNPAQNSISIKLEENNTFESAAIFDINGKQILNTTLLNDIDISTLLPGVYTIKVKTNSSEQKVKFIKH